MTDKPIIPTLASVATAAALSSVATAHAAMKGLPNPMPGRADAGPVRYQLEHEFRVGVLSSLRSLNERVAALETSLAASVQSLTDLLATLKKLVELVDAVELRVENLELQALLINDPTAKERVPSH